MNLDDKWWCVKTKLQIAIYTLVTVSILRMLTTSVFIDENYSNGESGTDGDLSYCLSKQASNPYSISTISTFYWISLVAGALMYGVFKLMKITLTRWV